MASLTVRQLDDKLKKLLRLRAARHGRSMEDEVRVILREAADETGHEIPDDFEPPSQPARHKACAADAKGNRVLLIIGGGIAAYKSLDLIRRLQDRGAQVRCVLTAAAQHFVTPLAAAALSGERVHTDLFDSHSEFDVGHIRLARDTDLIVVAPATADLLAKMAGGHADDLATAVLLATAKPILIAPAMNPQMWAAKATARNFAQLRSDGVHIVGPKAGEMAERGEAGLGRMAEPLEIVAAVAAIMRRTGSLSGKRILVTSGPTNEPIDPVHLPDPPGLSVMKVETAQQMLKAVEQALPADVAVFAAAVADWGAERPSDNKIKKEPGKTPMLALTENPDILSTIAHRNSGRPRLVIGFAAETDNVIANAQAKLAKKGCDWILANDVSPSTGIMGGDVNTIHLITAAGVESWPPQSKDDVARALIARIAAALAEQTKQ